MRRHRSHEGAAALWRVLGLARRPLTSGEATRAAQTSEVYGRRLLRQWTELGFLVKKPGLGEGRADGGPEYTLKPDAPPEPPIISASGEAYAREAAMSPAEFARARRRLGLSLVGLAEALGRTGGKPNMSRAMRRFEDGAKPIDVATAEKLRSLVAAAEAAAPGASAAGESGLPELEAAEPRTGHRRS